MVKDGEDLNSENSITLLTEYKDWEIFHYDSVSCNTSSVAKAFLVDEDVLTFERLTSTKYRSQYIWNIVVGTEETCSATKSTQSPRRFE